MGTAGGNFYLTFTNVRSAAIQNIVVYGPQYLTGTGASATPISPMPVFTKEFYNALAAYPAVDFYVDQDPALYNNGEISWAGRTLPGQIQFSQSQLVRRNDVYTAAGTNTANIMFPNNDTIYSSTYGVNLVTWGGSFVNGHQIDYGYTSKGMAYEYIIDYANTTGKDIWLYAPECADDEYFLNMALLIKNNLTNSNSHIYVSILKDEVGNMSDGYLQALGIMSLWIN